MARRKSDAKPAPKFWKPKSTSTPTTKSIVRQSTSTSAPKFWKPSSLDLRQEHNVENITWSAVEEDCDLFGDTSIRVTAIWYGKPVTGVALTWNEHRALARLPGTIGRDDDGGSRCSTCEFHNLGDPHTCSVAVAALDLLKRRTGRDVDDPLPF